ncbi:MAG: gfo/Idh/MocA family oxidoreductase [Phycisphaeraceae bacterium]|nr:MAG: gfo/Idh/MocA family oxidoreductase [Phycisphaeraceae bacterium]
MIGIGVIGLGFIGWHHIRAYQAAQASGLNCRLKAVCDTDRSRWEAGSDSADLLSKDEKARVRFHETVLEMLADPAIDLVSICTYTDSHTDLAIQALEAGKHVLVEKPVAVHTRDVRRLAIAAADARTLCMPAMCMRFWPGWDWLRDRIHDRSLGRVQSACFQRLGSPPAWASSFYADHSRSGGALVDLHIHDTDFICWCFGRPDSVASAGSLAHVTTLYRYEAHPGMHLTAEGGWSLHPRSGFRMRFMVCFERGTAEFDISRTPTLVLHTDSGSSAIEVGTGSGYDAQARHIIEAISEGRQDLRATMEHAVEVSEVLDAERMSLERSEVIRIG